MNSVLLYLLDLLKRAIYSPDHYARSIGVKVGKNCTFLRMTNYSSEPYLIEIGDNVGISAHVTLLTHDGGIFALRPEIPDLDVFGKIKIGSNSYIGANVTILPGVTIGENCIVGAGSVVTKSIPDNTVAAGVPCRFITTTEEYKKAALRLNTGTGLLKYKEKKQVLLSLADDKFIRKNLLRLD